MIPKFRAWDKRNKMMRNVAALLFLKDTSIQGIKYWKNATELKNLNAKNIILMQATGLQDKNGKTYYEGDLVKWDDEIFQVKFDRYQFLLEGFYEPRQDVPYDFFSEGAYKNAEVIGNIYENPDFSEEQSC